VLSVAGYQLGHAWNSVSHGLAVVGYILFALVVIAIAGFVVYRLRQFRRESAQGQAAQGQAAQAPADGEEQAHAPQDPAPPRRPGRHRSDAEV